MFPPPDREMRVQAGSFLNGLSQAVVGSECLSLPDGRPAQLRTIYSINLTELGRAGFYEDMAIVSQIPLRVNDI